MAKYLNAIKGLPVEGTLIDVFTPIYDAKSAVESLILDINLGPSLHGCRPAAAPFFQIANELLGGELSDQLSRFTMIKLQRTAAELEIVLTSELAVSNTYFVSDKKPFSTLTLVSEGESLFPFDLPRKVPEAVKDMREAGKCLAFELPTAAAFHILRAVEVIVRRYWEVKSGNKPKPTIRSLGVYIAALKKHNYSNEKTLFALSQLKDLHRNAIFHPEDDLDLQKAIGLMGIAQGVSSLMLDELPFVPTELPEPDNHSFPEVLSESSFFE